MVLLIFRRFLLHDTGYPCIFFPPPYPGKCQGGTNTGMTDQLMFLLQFAETCRPCVLNIRDISLGKRNGNIYM